MDMALSSLANEVPLRVGVHRGFCPKRQEPGVIGEDGCFLGEDRPGYVYLQLGTESTVESQHTKVLPPGGKVLRKGWQKGFSSDF